MSLPEDIIAERPHHPYSPSKLQGLEICPCMTSANDTVHIAAVLGQKQHTVTETGEDDLTLDDERAEHAAECLDFLNQHRIKFLEERAVEVNRVLALLTAAVKSSTPPTGAELLARADAEVPKVLELCEDYLIIDGRTVSIPVYNEAANATFMQPFVGTTAGYIDRCFISWDRKRAVMMDWKFGKWPVEPAKNNLQAIAYVLGIFRAYPSVETITFYFKLPAIGYVDEHTWTREDIAALYLRVLTVVQRAEEARRKNDFSMANPTVPGCLFCGARGQCPKLTQFACTVGKKYFPLEFPDSITPTTVLDPAGAALGMRLAQAVAAWGESFKRTTTDRVLRGDCSIPVGFSLDSREPRAIADVKKFEDAALKYLTPEELKSAADYTFGAVEDQISDKAPRGQKKNTVEAFKALTESIGAVKRQPAYAFLRAKNTKE